MRRVLDRLIRCRVWVDTHGQDLIEYALLAGMVALLAGAAMPSVSRSMSRIFSKVLSTLIRARATGS